MQERMILQKSKEEKTVSGCSLELEGVQGVWGPCRVSPGMPLTAVFGFLLCLVSFILFVANIYNSAQAQPY